MSPEPEQVQALVRYRMEQAHETIREAEILLNQHAWRGTMNRAYYAIMNCGPSQRWSLGETRLGPGGMTDEKRSDDLTNP